jgi:putative membrane protein
MATMAEALSHLARSRLGRAAAAALLTSAALGAWPLPAGAQEGAQGAALLRSVEDGGRGCDDLDPGDFEEIGEYLMGRMVGSPQAHESMDALMASMMGRSGEARMHEVMGRRLSACGAGGFPPGAAGMMGGLGAFGMMGGALGPGPDAAGGVGYGPMMGGFGGGSDPADADADFGHMDLDGGWWIVMGLGMVLFWGLIIVGIVWLVRELGGTSRGSHRAPDPLATLDHRLAAGEISPEEYRERREILSGTGRGAA